jgi:hypothetical protein
LGAGLREQNESNEMKRFEITCRALRDLGIFLLGAAAIMVAVDYLFVHPNPERDLQKAMYQAIAQGIQSDAKQPSRK